MKNYKCLYVIALTLILINGCKKKDNPVPDTIDDQEENVWHEDTRFNDISAILLNSCKSGDKLYVLGIHDLFSFSSAEDEEEVRRLPFTPGIDYKFPMREKFFIMANTEDNTIHILPYHMRGLFKSGITINMEELDENFTNFDFNYWRGGECIAVTESNHFLVPFRSGSDESIYFLTGKIKFIEPGDPEYTTTDYGKYWLDTVYTKVTYFDGWALHNYRSLDDINAWKDRFFVEYDDVLFLVDTLGNNTRIDDYSGIDYLYEKNDSLFAMAQRGLMYSLDEGYHWEWINDDLGNDCLALSFVTIQDQLVGFNGLYGSDLIHLKPNGNGFTCNALESEAIAYKAISSVSGLNDSAVYVTTMNGGFYKPLDVFFE